MRLNEDTQIKLCERHRRLLTSDHDSYVHNAQLVRDFIDSDALLSNLVAEAAAVEPDLDPKAWLEVVTDGYGDGPRWSSSTEAGQATLAWALLNEVAAQDGDMRMAWAISSESNLNDACRRMTEIAIAPLFDYLIERVADASSVTYTLERYARLVEWFDRDELLDAYEADTQRGEAVYDTHLRRFLFGEGFSMPFSQARSPSGDSDVVTHLEDEPLVCEVKLFDGDRKNKHHVATGVHQALLYAQDYGQSAAHLVIINLSGRPIELPTDGKGDSGLPYLDLSGVRIHFVPVRARRLASASKLGRAEPFVFTRGDLVEPD